MQIQTDVPMPKKKKDRPRRTPVCKGVRASYPFTDMEVGESVLVVDNGEWRRASNAAYMVGARDGKKFMARKSVDGLRIWRTL